MALMRRIGEYGSYYGDEKNSSHYLNEAQKIENAYYIKRYLEAKNWSLNAICGILGNMEVESTLNPGIWQDNDVGATSKGYGLVQWTPATKYQNWVAYVEDYSTMDQNLNRIIYELENNIQWIATSTYPISFQEFTTSTLDPGTLAKIFATNYERPAEVGQNRSDNAIRWYNTFNPTPRPTSSKKRFKWVLYANKIRKRNSI